jgi:hypothetical protein
MKNGIDRQGSVSPSSNDDDDDDDEAMDIDSKKIVSIADLCHPERTRNDRSAGTNGANGMLLLSQAAAELLEGWSLNDSSSYKRSIKDNALGTPPTKETQYFYPRIILALEELIKAMGMKLVSSKEKRTLFVFIHQIIV